MRKRKNHSYFSRQTSDSEKLYHSFELETLAVVESVRTYSHYLLGHEFKITTDCAALKHSFAKQDLNPKIGRYILELSEYRFELCHRKNDRMRHVDAKSRNPLTNVKNVRMITITEADWLLAAQQHDKSIQKIKAILETGDSDVHKEVFNAYALKVVKFTEKPITGLGGLYQSLQDFK